MSTNESRTVVKNSPRTAAPKSKGESTGSNKWIAFLLTTLIALGAAGYLFYENMQVKAAVEQAKAEKDAIMLEKTRLLNDLEEERAKLRSQLGLTSEKDSLINVYLFQLDEKEKKIRGYRSERGSIIRLKKEKEELITIAKQYEITIDSLNRQLLALNFQLKSSDSLTGIYKDQVAQLQAANGALSKKIELGSQLRVEGAELTPQAKGSKGKVEIAKSIKKANRLLLTFEIAENKLAESGDRTFYVRITDPKGKLIENSESGTFQNADHNLSFPYTRMMQVSFNNSAQKIKMPIEFPAKQVYPAGNYNMEFYCDGYLCGVKKVALK